MRNLIYFALAFLISLAADLSAQNIYWVDGVAGKIQFAKETGADPGTVVSGIGRSYGIAADLTNGKIYWTDNTDKTIKRVNLDGTNIETVVSQSAGSIDIPRGLALNVPGNKLYWTDNGTRSLMRANLDGSAVSVLVSGLDCPGYIAYDQINDKIYWADNGAGTKMIKRCNSDASVVETVVAGLGQVWGIALSVPDTTVYWLDSELGKIRKGSLNSLPVTPVDVVTNLNGSQRGLVIDKEKNYIFWSNTLNQILRAKLDGTEDTVIVSGLTNPQGLAINYDSALPVELTSFTASTSAKGVQLEWSTATEMNNSGFEVEKAVISSEQKLKNFTKIGFVKGAGTSSSHQSYSFSDQNAKPGVNVYRLKQINFDGSYEYSIESSIDIVTPDKYSLEQNYPNPFNPSTVIKYSLPEAVHVSLKVFDILGREVTTLVNELQNAGTYNSEFRTQNSELSAGVYIARLNAGKYSRSIKMSLLK